MGMQKQWQMTLRGMPASGRQWDADVAAVLLSDVEVGVVDAIPDLVSDTHWQAVLQRNGSIYQLTGHWNTVIKRHCSRCTAPFDWQVEADMDRSFQLGEEVRVSKRDADEMDGICEYIPMPGELNLIDVLREDIWLAWKADVVCDADCKGLCPGCGGNLNREACSCKQHDSGNPFAALRKLQLD